MAITENDIYVPSRVAGNHLLNVLVFASVQVIRMLEEPTAAALAFGLHRKPNVNHILVYDLGGGTLDVSLLFVNDGSVEVLGSDGDDTLGGKLHPQFLFAYFVVLTLRDTSYYSIAGCLLRSMCETLLVK